MYQFVLASLLVSVASAINIPRQYAYSPGPGVTPAASPTPSAPPCYNYADPDNAIPNQCVCTSGDSVTTVGMTTQGTLSNCYYTAYPTEGAPAPASFTAPSETNSAFYTITEGVDVVACTSTIVSRSDNFPVTSCVGSSYTISQIPHATVQQATSTQNAGTLGGTALYTVISSAIASACPPPPSGTFGGCAASAATITGVAYTYNTTTYTGKRKLAEEVNPQFVRRDLSNVTDLSIPGHPHDKRMCCDGIPTAVKERVIRTDGTLTINLPTSNYTSDNVDALIVLVASAFAGSAQGDFCQSWLNVEAEGPADRRRQTSDPSGSTTLCGTTSFAGVEYIDWDLNVNAPASFLAAELDFKEGLAETIEEIIACDALGAAASGILSLILGPEWALLGKITSSVVDYACKEALDVGS